MSAAACTRSGFVHAEQELMNACEHAELKHEQRFRAYREGIRVELGLGLIEKRYEQRANFAEDIFEKQKTSQQASSVVHVISSIEINHEHVINAKYINHNYIINSSRAIMKLDEYFPMRCTSQRGGSCCGAAEVQEMVSGRLTGAKRLA